MANYMNQMKLMQSFGSSRLKQRSKDVARSGNMVTSDADFAVDEGIADAMNLLEQGDDVKPDDYASDFSLAKNFTQILDATGRQTTEESKIYPVVRKMNDLNSRDYFAVDRSETAQNFLFIQDIQDAAEKCRTYLDEVNPWTASGKKRKALVKALEIQLKTAISNVYSKNGTLLNYTLKKFKEEHVNESGIDFLKFAQNETVKNFKGDILDLDDAQKANLKLELINDYGLSEEDAQSLMEHRDDISQASAYFMGSAAVTPEKIKKIASQYNAKKQAMLGGGGAAQANRRDVASKEAAMVEAKKDCKDKFGLDAQQILTGNTFVRVLTSIMDDSGTAEAKERNLNMVKDFCLTHKNSDGGFYWNLIVDFLNPDLTLFNNREPQYIVNHYFEIRKNCMVGGEMFGNVLTNMKAETGVEPDEETMKTISALTQFYSDYVDYIFHIYEYFTTEGSLYMDDDQTSAFGDLLNQLYGEERQEEGVGLGGNQGLDTRVDDYTRNAQAEMNTFSGEDLEVQASVNAFTSSRQKKFANSKMSAEEILRTIYGYKPLPNGPHRKKKPEEAAV